MLLEKSASPYTHRLEGVICLIAGERTSSTRQNLAAHFWPLETAALEDDRATVAIRPFTDTTEGLHVALEMEEETQRR